MTLLAARSVPTKVKTWIKAVQYPLSQAPITSTPFTNTENSQLSAVQWPCTEQYYIHGTNGRL